MGRYIGMDLGGGGIRVAALENGAPRLLPLEDGKTELPAALCAGKDGEVVVGGRARQMAARGAARLAPDIWGRLGAVEESTQTSPDGPLLLIQAALQAAKACLKSDIDCVVAAIPPAYAPDQRLALVNALERCGVWRVRLYADTLMDALAADSQGRFTGKMLVYDFGERGVTASLLETGDGIYEVHAHGRDAELGGGAIAGRLAKRLADDFRRQTGIDLAQDAMAAQRLRLAAEEASARLSTQPAADIYLPFIAMTPVGPAHLERTVRREDFNAMLADLPERLGALTRRVLEDGGCDASQVRTTLICGGASRAQWVPEALRACLAADRTQFVRGPEEGPAFGAALYADFMENGRRDVMVLDATAWTLSLGLKDGDSDAIIERNTTMSVKKIYEMSASRDAQTTMSTRLLVGESDRSAENRPIGRVTVSGVEAKPAGEASVALDVALDFNGVAIVDAKDAKTGKPLKLEIEGMLLAQGPPKPQDAPPEQPAPRVATPAGRVESDARREAARAVMLAVLPTMDNLELAIKVGRDSGEAEGMIRGVELTLRGMKNSLEKLGLREIPAEGAAFDPNLHHAVEYREGGQPGHVMTVVEKGYWLEDRVLRYAKVIVSK